MQKIKKIIFFGTYQNSHLYSRNQEIQRAYKNIGYDVTELQPLSNLKRSSNPAITSLYRVFIQILRQLLGWISLLRHIRKIRQHKLFLIPYPAHLDILLLKLCLLGKEHFIIMDAFLGLYDTIVEDRKLIRKQNLLAKLVKSYEKFALSLSHKILIDTEQQAEMLCNNYQISKSKLFSVPVGIDESVWYPRPYPESNDEFRVVFWGTFIPLHGIETIIKAAKLLETKSKKIKFRLVGTGQTASEIKHLLAQYKLTNLQWIDHLISHTELVEIVTNSHCVLGIFGSSNKADNVIPYKIYQALALNRPVVTRRSKTLANNLTEYSIHIVEPGSETQLAEILLKLADDNLTCSKSSSYDYYQKHLSNDVIKNKIQHLMESLENA